MDYSQFQRPQRYIGNEWNVIKKFHSGKIRICISYPDLYEIGMSNLGIRIIYGILNDFADVACERVFMPAEGILKFLRKNKTPFFSLETKTALCDFDILGFNFSYELNFTNFLHILDLGRVELYSEKRKDIIVLGGGVANPEPLADFVDVFCLGEFEEVAENFVDILRREKSKLSRLRALSEIEGFYVPAFYLSQIRARRYLFEKKYRYATSLPRRVYVKDLNQSYYPSSWLTPYTAIVHDRAQIEIARGCPNQCVFCQAKPLYHPYRQRRPQKVLQIAKEIYATSGYENFSFLALSASDYSQIEELIDQTLSYFKEKRVGFSLPSLRVSDLVGRLYKKLIPLKKISLTLAIEAAKQALRERLNKKVDLKEVIEAAKIIRSLKMRHIKVYFMFGFPDEDNDDLVAIGDFLSRLSAATNLDINASINIFIPKPFSLWEAVSMQDESVLRKKREVILNNIPRKRQIKLSFSYPKKSILETVISRGDRMLSSVIHQAYLRGAKFDGEDRSFSWQIWEESFNTQGIDYRFYLEKNTENFPWSFIT